MIEMEELGLTLFIIFMYFLGCITGFGLRASFSRYRRHNSRKARHAGLAAAEGELRHARRDGKERSTRLLAVVTALIVVFGLIVLDHFKGRFLPEAFYCLSDGGTQITGKCAGRAPP